MNQPWLQNFDPLGNTLLSTLAAAIPVCTLFYFLAVRRTPAWRAAVYAFAAASVERGVFPNGSKFCSQGWFIKPRRKRSGPERELAVRHGPDSVYPLSRRGGRAPEGRATWK